MHNIDIMFEESLDEDLLGTEELDAANQTIQGYSIPGCRDNFPKFIAASADSASVSTSTATPPSTTAPPPTITSAPDTTALPTLSCTNPIDKCETGFEWCTLSCPGS